MFKLKRVYEKSKRSDGYRVLVDRLWPRGLSKKDADLDLWLKDIAPSDNLRKWYLHDTEKWGEFKRRYKKELKDKEETVRRLQDIVMKNKDITLLFSAKDESHNNAVALKEYLEK